MNLGKSKQYEEWKLKVSAYEMALNVLEVDKATVAPKGGFAYRDERTAFLAGELFSLMTSEQSVSLLTKIKDEQSLPYDIRKEASLYYKNVKDLYCIPKNEYVDYQNVLQQSYGAWLKAKAQHNYAGFAPFLKQIITYKKRFYGYRNSALSLYDQMLDDHEPGMCQETYDAFFDVLKTTIVPLAKEIQQAEDIDDSFLYQSFDTKVQKQFTEEVLLPFLHFDSSWGYQNETEHPFTTFLCENDCRTTTNYHEKDMMSSIFSTIHETGHAWYMHNVDSQYDGSILSFGISSGMHESQSRFCENYLGRRSSFWMTLYPQLQAYFPRQLQNVTFEKFVRAINRCHPSLIRIEADELTYPLHILIRYEMEKEIFQGKLAIDDLEMVWNQKYKEYLGVEVPDASVGILQDIHWSQGDIGYFPTYALGSAYGAQFLKAMQKDIDVDATLKKGDYMTCMHWLQEHIHHYGALYDGQEMMKIATKQDFCPNFYTDYLIAKYTRLYQL